VHPYFLQEQKLTFTAAVELEDNKLPVKQWKTRHSKENISLQNWRQNPHN
jgi:hypothetical protein